MYDSVWCLPLSHRVASSQALFVPQVIHSSSLVSEQLLCARDYMGHAVPKGRCVLGQGGWDLDIVLGKGLTSPHPLSGTISYTSGLPQRWPHPEGSEFQIYQNFVFSQHYLYKQYGRTAASRRTTQDHINLVLTMGVWGPYSGAFMGSGILGDLNMSQN